jgi:hypothetical protein
MYIHFYRHYTLEGVPGSDQGRGIAASLTGNHEKADESLPFRHYLQPLHSLGYNGIICCRNRVEWKRGGYLVARMFRVLGFWTLVIALMAFAGNMYEMSLLFFIQTAVFFLLGYLNFSERAYLMMFWGYMAVAFLGFTYWSVFQLRMPL